MEYNGVYLACTLNFIVIGVWWNVEKRGIQDSTFEGIIFWFPPPPFNKWNPAHAKEEEQMESRGLCKRGGGGGGTTGLGYKKASREQCSG